ncbi:MAG: 30S ribosomal protein S16 [Parcubacteria group bacterium]
MLKIRLQRIGKKKQAYYKVVVTEHTRKPKGQYLELLGSYDPHAKKIEVDAERVKHWLSHGAKASATVHNLMVGHNIIEGKKVTSWKPKKKKVEESEGKADAPKKEEVKTEEVKEETKTDEPEAEAETKPELESKEGEIKEEVKEEPKEEPKEEKKD